jgi:uncharacterized membrane protein YfcA
MAGSLSLAPAAFALVLVIVTVGSAVQGTLGFGANMLITPLLAVVEPEAVPVTPMLLVVPLATLMVWREHHGVDRRAVGLLTLGRLPGTVLGAAVVAAVAAGTLSVLAGLGVLAAVAASLASATVPVTTSTTLATGAVSGAMGTATSIGGPPVALLYQHHEGRRLRATLAATFLIGVVLSLAALALAGEVTGAHVGLALMLVPGTLVGVAASGRLTGLVDRGGWLRPAVLAFAAATALVAIARGLV